MFNVSSVRFSEHLLLLWVSPVGLLKGTREKEVLKAVFQKSFSNRALFLNVFLKSVTGCVFILSQDVALTIAKSFACVIR